MKDVTRLDKNVTHKLVRDESDRTYWGELEEDTTHLYDRNKRIRLEGLMARGQKLPAFGDHVAFSFSMPQTWNIWLKRNHPDILAQLLDKDPEENLKGARRLALVQPEWVTIEGNW